MLDKLLDFLNISLSDCRYTHCKRDLAVQVREREGEGEQDGKREGGKERERKI